MYFLFSFCRVLSRMHESMTDLRKLVAETQVPRPKTDIGGFDQQADSREGQGNMTKLLIMFSVLTNYCKSDSL